MKVPEILWEVDIHIANRKIWFSRPESYIFNAKSYLYNIFLLWFSDFFVAVEPLFQCP